MTASEIREWHEGGERTRFPDAGDIQASMLIEIAAQLAELNATQLAILNEWRAHAEWSRERIKDYR